MTSIPGPVVSFVVIAHNERMHGPLTVRSILDQRADVPFEVILVDDGSSDGTAEAVQSAIGGDPRLRILRLEKNQGRGAARSAGIGVALGEFIASVDADITLPLDWLDRCLDSIPGHAAVGGVPVPDGDVAVIARLSGARSRVVPPLMPVAGSNTLFRASVLRQTSFDSHDQLGEDFRLATRLLKEGARLRRVPGLIVRHEEDRTYTSALRWRFENGMDAVRHLIELGRVRSADVAWFACLASTAFGLAAGLTVSPLWFLLGPLAIAGAALAHVWSRFFPTPLGPFVAAWLANIPLMAAYVVGRTVGLPRLFKRA